MQSKALYQLLTSTLRLGDPDGALLGLPDNDGESEGIDVGCPDELGESEGCDDGAPEADGLSLGADDGCWHTNEDTMTVGRR